MLSISLDNNKTWSTGLPIVFYSAVRATVARRPYILETEGALVLQSDAVLKGAILDVAVLLTSQRKTWRFSDLAGGATTAALLPLPFAGLPLTLNNDLLITVTVSWARAGQGNSGEPYTLTIYSRLIRAAPPPASSRAVPVQVDHEHVGALRVGGRIWNGVGWYVKLNPPDSPPGTSGIPTLANMSMQLAMLGQQGVNLAMIYNLGAYSPAKQQWMLDQAHAASVKLLLEFPAPPGYKSKDPKQTCGEWLHDSAYKARVLSTIAIAVDHPALLGYFLCDDCVTQGQTWSDNYRCISTQAQLCE